eukprot:TRINITY_DN13853_c0_g1_i1.p1 TRINITY_DN13853_c0_g1~~TRINITY_DN13853_c0_g1_i1.p1  ORF type:complete len:118 (+),score=9.83 TRINITY_DN13853_c0_g1_i1:254-607(+)
MHHCPLGPLGVVIQDCRSVGCSGVDWVPLLGMAHIHLQVTVILIIVIYILITFLFLFFFFFFDFIFVLSFIVIIVVVTSTETLNWAPLYNRLLMRLVLGVSVPVSYTHLTLPTKRIV